MALANLWRTPGRTLLGGFALAVGVCALTLLAVVQWTFHGAAVGTVLGDAVALQVRNVDLVAVATTVLLGVFAVADVLYLNLRERAAELAVLQATGWSSGALLRLIGYEGAGLGLLGALGGAGSAIGLALALFGQEDQVDAVIAVAGLTAGSGVLLTMLAAAAPAMFLRRLPTASLLAEE
jgi:ABC-type antimicrobial peptide transport system permease subunit